MGYIYTFIKTSSLVEKEVEAINIWDITTGKALKTLRLDRLYEGMNITGVKGITEAEKATLKALGAIEIES